MPSYNEQATIRTIVARVLAVDLGAVEKELVIARRRSRMDGTRTSQGADGKMASRVSFSRTTRARARPSGRHA